MTPSPTEDRLRRTAAEVFGWTELRPGQLEAMTALAEGRDVVVVMPTGRGKSAVYQVAAVDRPGPTVVVSPLVSLQHDQVEGLRDHEAAAARAVAINSTRTAEQRERGWQRLAAGTVEFVFLSPEQLAGVDVVERVAAAEPSLVVVDEAHCVSSWGHDFRPDYLRVGDVLHRWGRPPVAALTATAAPPVRAEIAERLGMRDPLEVVAGFDRPGIALQVRRFADDHGKRAALVETAVAQQGLGLVYTSTRPDTERLAERLREEGVDATAYHAGLPAAERRRVHDAFRDGTVRVVVATSAFGMGIDKPDVRFVLHAAVPDSVDTYYQEVGRAGRDGEPADAVLFYRSEDLGLRRFFGSRSPATGVLRTVASAVLAQDGERPVADLARDVDLSRRRVVRAVNLLEEAGIVQVDDGAVRPVEEFRDRSVDEAVAAAVEASEARARRERSRLEMMRGYAETTGCRRRYLLGYFGEPLEHDCGRCDTCWEGSAARTHDGPHDGAGETTGFAVDDRVVHPEWGPGVVMSLDEDRLTVLFESEGYKTLDAALVADHELLVPEAAERAAG